MTAPPRVAETHTAWVILLGDRVYKVKKPVQLEFLDFSTREAREQAAHREVELNRRLAPDVYLGVADVTGPDGLPCEHVVVMRRMPDDRRLSTLVAAGQPVDAELRAIARTLAGFHAGADRSPQIDAAARPAELRASLERELHELRAFAPAPLEGDVLDEVGRRARRFLDGRAALLDERIARGLVCDGHGDLLADDVFCLPDGPRILDCLEFDARLRHVDVLNDVAFLAMDLERLGAPELASSLLSRYSEFSAEAHADTLAHYYVATRAMVRAKVSAVRAAQGDHDAAALARALLALALDHLRRAQVHLVLVGGAPGTGKSTLAGGLADRLGWVVVRSDVVRKDLAQLGHDVSAAAPYGEGLYAAERKDATYRALLDRARLALERGESVIVDASWSTAGWRQEARAVAADTASELVELRCSVAPELATARIVARRTGDAHASDADAEIAAAVRAGFDPWPSAQMVSTTGTADETLRAALPLLTDVTLR
jgi:aminoglycoside phosphotransferase family enzyme/predicted kinase